MAENQGQKLHFSLVADRLMIGGNYRTSRLDSDQLTKEQPTMLCRTRNLWNYVLNTYPISTQVDANGLFEIWHKKSKGEEAFVGLPHRRPAAPLWLLFFWSTTADWTWQAVGSPSVFGVIRIAYSERSNINFFLHDTLINALQPQEWWAPMQSTNPTFS